MNRWLLSALAVLLATGFIGCAGIQHGSEDDFGACDHCPRPTNGEYWDHCRNCYGATPCGGTTHCGLCGKGRCLARESCQLVNCLFSYRWEGSYPNGSLGPWEGSWSGGPCCGPGCSDPTCEECSTAQ